MTLKALLQQAVSRLAASGITTTAKLDAELLLCNALDCQPTYLFTWPEHEPTNRQKEQFQQLIERRLKGEPVAYLLGKQAFWSFDLIVNEHTLIPRPDTECLVDYVLSHYADDQPLTLWDAGTGSGAIALALKKERPGWLVFASDLSEEALHLTKQNSHQLSIPLMLCRGSWLSALRSNALDVVISNPPYIREADPHLKALTYEPTHALVADNQGLAAIQAIAFEAFKVLKSGGLLVIEHGYDQKMPVQTLFKEAQFESVTTCKDLGGNDRFTVGKKS